MKLLFLNQTFYPDVAASAQHLADLAVALVRRGHEVTVITARRAYDDPGTVFGRHEWWQGVRILRVGSTGLGKNGRWRRLGDFASYFALAGIRGSFIRRPDVVVSLSSPPLIGIVGLWLARLHRSGCVQWILDLNPDQAVAAGWLRGSSLITRCLEFGSRRSLRAADRVIVLDKFMSKRVEDKGIEPKRISILPPWSDEPAVRFDAEGRDRFRRQHGLTDKFVVMYSGNHSPCHPLETVIEAARQLRYCPEIVFCFVGGGSEFRRLQAMLDSTKPERNGTGSPHPVGNIMCLPYQAREEIAGSLSAADLHVVIMGKQFVGIVHPCKIYNILAVGAPVVYVGSMPSPVSDVLRSVCPPGVWGAVAHENVSGLVDEIQRMRKRWLDSTEGRPTFNTTAFRPETVIPRLIEQLESAARGGFRGGVVEDATIRCQ